MSESNKDRRTFLAATAGMAGAMAIPSGAADAAPASGQSATGTAPVCLPGIPIAGDYEALRKQRMTEVDPQMRQIYDQAAAAPPIRQTGIEAMRKAEQRPENAVIPDGVTARNIEIPGPAGPIPTRVWMPEGVTEPVGVYLSTHGGGWNFSNGLEYHDAEEGQHVLDWGCAVVRPDYRIAPEHKFPAAIEDCYAALTYLGRHGHRLGLDPTRIGIGGGCAGANMGTVVSLMARDAGEQTPAIQFLWSPACDMRNNYQSYVEFANGYGLRADDADFVSKNYLRSREDCYDWRASPILVPSLKDAPPALVWVGEWEILYDETLAYVHRMRDAGVRVHLFEGPQQGHGFLYLHRDTDYAKATLPEINRIMRSYIGPRNV
ncbi:alpha/beta hydrolase [Sciscionella sediminilitoris]|uniref:alpha/beta hydrolase n=1 Tax=Sciscionella sediminilitoris TaxID=1445613 RepID=UPI0009ECA5C9|nr:alpha/beta hydrolase [Sciscionella sp. SE31]